MFMLLEIPRRVTVLLVLILSALSLFAQTDSLEKLLKTNLTDTTRVQILNKLAIGNLLSTPEKALEYTLQATELAQKTAFKSGLALSYLNTGRAYYFLNDYQKAIEFSFKSLTEYEQLNDKRGIAAACNNVGGLYYVQRSYTNSMEFYQRALKIYEELNDKKSMATLLGNIGAIDYDLNKFDEALKYYYTALDLLKHDPSQLYALSSTYGSIANAYWAKKNFQKSIEYNFKTLAIQKQLHDNNGIGNTLTNIGGMYNDYNQPDSAIKYLEEAIQIATSVNNKKALMTSYNFMGTAFEKKNDLKESVKYHKLYAKYLDSLFNSDSGVKMSEELSKYQADKRDRERDLIEQAREAEQNAKLEKQRLITIGISTVAVLILILLVFIYRGYKQKQKANAIINQQKELAEAQKLQIEEKQKEIVDSINYAKRIQDTLLSHGDYLKKHLPEHFVFFRPKDIVSGDFYWATAPKNDRNLFYLAVCDSTGHGVPGAFMSLLNISFLNEAINEKGISEPGEILNYVRKRLIKNISQDGGQDGMDGIIICINKDTGTISYAAANNTPVLVSGETINELSADRMPVGKSDKEQGFSTHVINYKKGDLLYLYTDGFADQFGGPKGKKYKYKALNDHLLKISRDTITAQEDNLSKEFMNWKGELEQVDDVCIIGIKL